MGPLPRSKQVGNSMQQYQVQTLAETVQRNCHISDARHGGDYSLCIYLMKMREYYRWEKHLPLGAALEKDAVGEWLAAREELWDELVDAELSPVEIAGERFDPFDADAINARLAPEGLVYSSGLGNQAKPHFFLADLERCAQNGDCSVYVSAEEHARDLTAPPAMSLGKTIFLRRESLRRMLWEKLESWRWSRPDNALGRAFACYAFDSDFDAALNAMTDREIDNTLLHEQGEHRAGLLLGDVAWGEMLLDLAQTPAELMARAVRDHLADCLVTLPQLLERIDTAAQPAALHFYVGNLTNMRKSIFPSLAEAYESWRQDADLSGLRELAELGRDHWHDLGAAMLELYRQQGAEAAGPIRELVSARHL
ncbi:Sfum_1244 family protein [Halochromatium sp.]